MDAKILKYVPISKREAVHDCYRDSDGYWVTLNEGYHVEYYFAERVIHEDTIKELRKVFPNIRKD